MGERDRRHKHPEIDLAQPPKALIGAKAVLEEGKPAIAEPQPPKPKAPRQGRLL
jgi:hypothetical protein